MSEIRAGTTSTTALVTTGDTTGNIVLTPDSGILTVNGTGALTIPVGTTAQRPASPVNGMTRFNTTLGITEWYSATLSTWLPFSSAPAYTVEFLLVAGGGGGTGSTSGGGGAGGLIDISYSVVPATPYSIIVGAGASSVATQTIGFNGNNSTAFGYTSIGGGRGAGSSSSTPLAGSTGGSGGGGGGYVGGGGIPNSGNGYAGTFGQGFAGGNRINDNGGGGGGGAGSVGSNATPEGGAGGVGVNWKSLGTFYGGGGGGGGASLGGAGGSGGGGNGNTTIGFNGAINTGGGGGGGFSYASGGGGAGGSGIFTLRYIGSPRGTGGTITSVGGYTYHIFTSSGTFTA